MLSLPRPDLGVLFVLSGPSGVGKSTLIGRALERVPGIGFSVSATTRAPIEGEEHGVHYHFLDREAFVEAIGRGEFLEHAEVYGCHYGTLRAPVEQALAEGRSILLDIDVQGAAQVRASMPEATSVFILPPSRSVLERRLRSRGTDDEPTIARRIAEADVQLRGCAEYDHLVVNDDLDSGAAALTGVLLAALSRTSLHQRLVGSWISEDSAAPAG